MGKKNAKKSAGAEAKKAAKKAAIQKEVAKQTTVKAAKAAGNPLAGLPPAFCAYNRNGMVASIEFHTAATLPKADLEAIHTILDDNMAPVYGQEEWEEEARADKQKELLEEDCRLLIVRGSAAESSPPSPAASPVKDAGTAYDDDDDEAGGIGEIAAFVHFRYEIEEEALLLYIYELQIADKPWARRKGLGKFLLMLTEMISKKAGFGGVMLTCQRANSNAAAFYTACKYTMDAISPLNVDPTAADDDYNYEIYSKLWDADTEATLARRAGIAANMWAAEHDGRLQKDGDLD